MPIIDIEDVIAWQNKGGWILCDDCADRGKNIPFTSGMIGEEDIVICDKCGERIQ